MLLKYFALINFLLVNKLYPLKMQEIFSPRLNIQHNYEQPCLATKTWCL